MKRKDMYRLGLIKPAKKQKETTKKTPNILGKPVEVKPPVSTQDQDKEPSKTEE
ncbi:MAG: hypothetical protein ACRC78_05645 [Planktothrix sp.]